MDSGWAEAETEQKLALVHLLVSGWDGGASETGTRHAMLWPAPVGPQILTPVPTQR